MSPNLNRTATAQIALGVLIVAATFAAFALGGDVGQAALNAGLVLGFLILVLVGRRHSGTLDVMSGIGDERSRSLYTRAVAFAGTVMSFVLPGWWLVTVAQGRPDATLTWLCAAFGATFLLAVLVLARRG